MGTEQGGVPPPPGAPRPGQLSPDGAHYWDGQEWRSVIAPDGQYRWDGTAWVAHVPSTQPAPPAPPQQPAYQAAPSAAAQPAAAPRKSRGCCIAFLLALAVIIALVVAGVAAGGRYLGALNPPVTGSGCTQPCANQSGWIVEVTKFVYGAKSEDATPEPGNVFVTMDVTFTNKSNREQHANPATFVLKDGKGVKRSLEFMGPCPAWSPVNVTAGGSFGPKCLTFQAAAGKPAGIALVWTPNFLGSDYSIHLS